MTGSGNVAHGVMFHHFHDERHPQGQGSISADEFEEILQFVGVDNIVSAQEWIEGLERGTLREDQVCLTFDDGLLCQFEVALPVLERHGLKAFWFIYSSVFEGQIGKLELYRFFRSTCFDHVDRFYDLFFQRVFESEFAAKARGVLEEQAIAELRTLFPFYSANDVKFRLIRDRALERHQYERFMDEFIQEDGLNVEEAAQKLWMSNDQLRTLSNHGHQVGLHSYSHPTVLAALPVEEQLQEYERNDDHIRRACRQGPVAMAHPCNSYSEETLSILRQLGIRCGFRSNMAPRREGQRLNPNPFELAREDHANIMRRLVC